MSGTDALKPRVLGYLDAIAARPGQRLRLHVSVIGGGPYSAELVRLTRGDMRPLGPGPREEPVPCAVNGSHDGGEQRTECGSHIVVDRLPPLAALRLDILVWATLPGGRRQTLMHGGDIALTLDDRGAAAIAVGAAILSTSAPLAAERWYRVTAAYDPASGMAWIDCAALADARPASRRRVEGRLPAGARMTAPLTIAASRSADGRVHSCFDGKLEAPAIASGSASLRWNFATGIGTRTTHDESGHRCHGTTVNAPKRAVTGASWDGSVHDWRQSPAQYAAIHFHHDDLHDAGWPVSHVLELPATLRSGYYAVRLVAGESPPFHVGFVVSPAPGSARAKLAMLASTATYLCYANQRSRLKPGVSDLALGTLPFVDATDLLLADLPALGASTYDVHADGSGVCHASALRPLFNFRPTGRLWNFAMDLCLIDWLDQQGYDYDVINDHDLHRHGAALLAPYGCVVTGSHPEYVSVEMLDALESFLGRGGRLVYAGGNGFYWRITFDPVHLGLIEVRRAEDGARPWAESPGQYYHATGEYGGLWRRIGRPPNRLVGIGFVAQGFDVAVPYRRTAASYDPRVAFLFEGIESEQFGDFGAWGGGAAGAEIDAFGPGLGAPAHTLVVASSAQHSNAYLLTKEEMLTTLAIVDGTQNARVRADMAFFETQAGGAVLSTGSIAFVASLGHRSGRNDVSRLLANALDRFLDPAPFAPPAG